MARTSPALALALALLLAMGCASLDPPPPPAQIVVVRVMSDPHKPVRNATILFGGRKIGETADDGTAEVQLAGKDGETFEVTVACPKGFESPSSPVRIVFRRLADPSKKPQYEVVCAPKTRTVVVAVRSDGAADVPVTLLGREIARTDSSGAAHLVLTLEPGERFDLMMDTSDDRFQHLRPQNPVASFGVGQQDDIFTFDQKFDSDRPRRRPTGPGRVKPKGPVKIGR